MSSSRDLPDPESEPASPALAGRLFTTEPPGKPKGHYVWIFSKFEDTEEPRRIQLEKIFVWCSLSKSNIEGFFLEDQICWESVNHRFSGAGQNPPGLFVLQEEEGEGRRLWTRMEKGTGKAPVLSPEEEQLLDLAASPLGQVWLNHKEENDFGKAWRIPFIMSWSCPIFWYAFSNKTCYFRALIWDVSSLS